MPDPRTTLPTADGGSRNVLRCAVTAGADVPARPPAGTLVLEPRGRHADAAGRSRSRFRGTSTNRKPDHGRHEEQAQADAVPRRRRRRGHRGTSWRCAAPATPRGWRVAGARESRTCCQRASASESWVGSDFHRRVIAVLTHLRPVSNRTRRQTIAKEPAAPHAPAEDHAHRNRCKDVLFLIPRGEG